MDHNDVTKLLDLTVAYRYSIINDLYYTHTAKELCDCLIGK
jgi:hypothetical protein